VQDYGARLYNPAIGKFLSVDPITRNYPMLTPYQFASNTPISAIDLDGLEAKVVRTEVKPGLTKIQIVLDVTIKVSSSCEGYTIDCIKNAFEATKKMTEYNLSEPRYEVPEQGEYYEFKFGEVKYSNGDDISPFVIDIADLPSSDLFGTEMGIVDKIGDSQNNKIKIGLSNIMAKHLAEDDDGKQPQAAYEFANVIAHEIGHTLGLRHPSDQDHGDKESSLKVSDSPTNLMRTDTLTSGNKLLRSQFESMVKLIDEQTKDKPKDEKEKKN
jgi:hypothetical protein